MAVILGVDPGSRYTGWGVIRSSPSQDLSCLAYGVLEMGESMPFTERLAKLLVLFEEKIEQYKPDCIAVERVFMAKNADSAFKLGHARGVIIAVAARAGLKVHEYAARHAKKMLTGNGAASKEQVQWWVEKMFALPATERLDATDALALAVCHAREADITNLLYEAET